MVSYSWLGTNSEPSVNICSQFLCLRFLLASHSAVRKHRFRLSLSCQVGALMIAIQASAPNHEITPGHKAECCSQLMSDNAHQTNNRLKRRKGSVRLTVLGLAIMTLYRSSIPTSVTQTGRARNVEMSCSPQGSKTRGKPWPVGGRRTKLRYGEALFGCGFPKSASRNGSSR